MKKVIKVWQQAISATPYPLPDVSLAIQEATNMVLTSYFIKNIEMDLDRFNFQIIKMTEQDNEHDKCVENIEVLFTDWHQVILWSHKCFEKRLVKMQYFVLFRLVLFASWLPFVYQKDI